MKLAQLEAGHVNGTPRSRRMTGKASLRLATAALAVGGLGASTVMADAAGAAKAKRVVVATVQNPQLGTILVSGKTLYTLDMPTCTGKCLTYWPALVLPKGVKKATPGKGVRSAKLGIIHRAHGVRQVTYGGKPLYWFAGDTAAGQVNGDVTDQWGTWSVFVTAQPSVTTPTAAPGATTAPTAAPASGGSQTHTTSPPTTAPAHTNSPAPTSPPATTSPAPTTPPTSPPTTTTAPSSGGVAF